MSILWCGGEDIDFPNGAPVIVNTTASYKRAVSRCHIYQNASAFSKSSVFPGGEITSGWFSFQVFPVTSGVNSLRIGLGKSGSAKGLYLGIGSSALKLNIYKWDDTTATKLVAETGASLSGVVHKVDVQLINYGGAGTINVYLDSTLLMTYTGDISISGVTGFDSVMLYGTSAGGYFGVSEIIVADEDTRTMSLVACGPTGAGDANTFTTGTYAEIDETTNSDLDVMSDNTNGHAAQVAIIDLPAGTFSIKHVAVKARAVQTGSAVSKLKLGVRSGATTNVDSSQTAPGYWGILERNMATNPITASKWQQSEIDSLQMAFEVAT